MFLKTLSENMLKTKLLSGVFGTKYKYVYFSCNSARPVHVQHPNYLQLITKLNTKLYSKLLP